MLPAQKISTAKNKKKKQQKNEIIIIQKNEENEKRKKHKKQLKRNAVFLRVANNKKLEGKDQKIA